MFLGISLIYWNAVDALILQYTILFANSWLLSFLMVRMFLTVTEHWNASSTKFSNQPAAGVTLFTQEGIILKQQS